MNSVSPTPATGHDDDSHGDAISHGTLKGYLTGFVLAAILTAIPFWLVMGHVIASPAITIILVLALGLVQLYVHMVYFLHMNAKTEEGWSLTSLAFTLVLLVIVLAGSIWVMYWLNTNMMMGPMGH
ncbi:MAG: cytochrome o ubiquinol oxidase subunit IV [Sinobacteraceae bacterium]|nr:cytochrome o ubiquinol oxidase subunit IV [Nevskiaceae bacterium]